MEKTHIEITKETRRKLRVWKAERDMTYDEAIRELIKRDETLETILDEVDSVTLNEIVGRTLDGESDE